MEFCEWMDKNPKWLKIVLAIGFLDILWMVYRIIKCVNKKNDTGLIVSIVLLVFCSIWWIVDIVTLALQDRIIEFDNAK